MKLSLLPRNNTDRSKRQRLGIKVAPTTTRGKTLLTFFVFLAVSAGWWMVTSLQATYVDDIKIPIVYTNSSQYAISGDMPQFIDAKIEDTGVSFLFNYTFRTFNPIKLEITAAEEETEGRLLVSYAQLEQLIQKQLEQRTKIQALYPQEINLRLNRLESKEVNVISQVEVHPLPGYLVKPFQVMPLNVTLYGSKEALRYVVNVRTQISVVEQQEGQESLTVSLPLLLPDGVSCNEDAVRVKFEFEELTEKSFTLDIAPMNVPDGYRLRVLPAKAELRITIPKSLYSRVDEEDFRLLVDYAQLSSIRRVQTDQMLPIILNNPPEWLERYAISPARIQYILEEDTPLRTKGNE